MDLGSALLDGGENALNGLLGAGGVVAGASASPAGSTPAATGSAQPQAPATGQGNATTAKPVNYVPWIAAGAVLLGIIVLIAVKK